MPDYIGLHVPCPTCGALPGERCILLENPTGWRSIPHYARQADAQGAPKQTPTQRLAALVNSSAGDADSWRRALESVLKEVYPEEALRLNALEEAARPAQVGLEASAYSVPCRKCGASAGEACRTGADPGMHVLRYEDAATEAAIQEEQRAQKAPTEERPWREAIAEAQQRTHEVEARVGRKVAHQHEAGQVREAPDGSHYCAACGDTVQRYADGIWRTV